MQHLILILLSKLLGEKQQLLVQGGVASVSGAVVAAQGGVATTAPSSCWRRVSCWGGFFHCRWGLASCPMALLALGPGPRWGLARCCWGLFL